ncbi:MAG: hypothetical protein N5P05_002171 [Chroococcopsis gigantea SAG 12.99]|jgi:Ca2+-binding RTX toxin-like protein|nr:calcium-binding protein [Chlorogloea purpurea SAG 13.99]MDV3000565.1 hypothetical protein [Chroococcopsis gigantea SAG 12.99]
MPTYTGTNNNDNLPPSGSNNSGNDIFIPLLGIDTLDGGSGDDLLIINYSSNTYSGTTSYAAGIRSSVGENTPGSFSGYYYAYKNASAGYDRINFSNIERFQITGTNFNDIITTGWGNDSINGGGGDDIIDGKGGIDSIDGGGGTDTLIYLDASDETAGLTLNNTGVSIALSSGVSLTRIEQFQNVDTGSGNDTIVFTDALNHNIDTAWGNDSLITGSGNDTVKGGNGNDTINAGLGRDNVDGQGGNDLLIVDYSGNTYGGTTTYPAGLVSSISASGSGGWNGNYYAYNNNSGGYDQVYFYNIERFQLTGTGSGDVFGQGGYGSVIDGRGGVDTITNTDASNETNNLTINNAGGTLTLSDGSVIKNVEQFQNLNTGSGNDTIVFTDALNHNIDTGAGNDGITTGSGNDTVKGGSGNDTLNAGLGRDNVDGQGGNDLLIVDYSGNTYGGTTTYPAGLVSSISASGSGGWNGNYYAYNNNSGGYDQVYFYNIERSQLTGTGYGDVFGQGGYSFIIDGRSGVDTITNTDASNETNNLTINNAGGTLTLSDGSVIKNVEQFQNLNTGSGNDSIVFTDTLNHNIDTGAGNDGITTGSGNDTVKGGSGNDTLNAGLGRNNADGGKGNDLLIVNYSTNTYAGTTSYTAGIKSSLGYAGVGAWNGNYYAYNNSSGGYDQVYFYNIERFQITGTNYNDSILGGSNNDTIKGGAGSDTLDGGGGSDTLSYTGSSAGVNVNLATNTATGGDSTGDVIANFESAIGSGNNDTLTGTSGDNTINGGAGADSLNGGAGTDSLSYETSTAAVNVNLATNAATGGDATGDIISNFENLTGSNSNDTLIGSTGINTINGGGGNDLIDGGVGADSLDGGGGIDTLAYDTSTAGVNVNLSTNTATGGSATGDVIANFENITGSGFNDSLTGNTAANALVGGNGNDTLTGGAGGDSLTGGAGQDRFVYTTLSDSLLAGVDTITDFNATAGNDLFRVAVARSTFTNAGTATGTTLSAAISAVLNNTNFTANSAAQLSYNSRIYVAINDGTAGFSASTDGVVDVTGLTGTLALANFVTV